MTSMEILQETGEGLGRLVRLVDIDVNAAFEAAEALSADDARTLLMAAVMVLHNQLRSP